MPQTPSPLRYPGGKTSIWPMISSILQVNELERCHYAEPYAGGGGLALSLLFRGFVHEIHLNDIDRSIWSLWDSVLNHTDFFIEKINSTPVSIEEWHKQREIQENKDRVSDFDLGFSSFFLNRTNRSGIILRAGVIGGLNQSGKYKLDCRFNKNGLIDKIKRIEKYKDRIHIYNQDAVSFLKSTKNILPQNTFYCIDPPYFNKGSTLYTNYYEPDNHAELAQAITEIKHPWVLTYDNAVEIQELYSESEQYRFNLNYSAATKRIGTELFIASPQVLLPRDLNLMKIAA